MRKWPNKDVMAWKLLKCYMNLLSELDGQNSKTLLSMFDTRGKSKEIRNILGREEFWI